MKINGNVEATEEKERKREKRCLIKSVWVKREKREPTEFTA